MLVSVLSAAVAKAAMASIVSIHPAAAAGPAIHETPTAVTVAYHHSMPAEHRHYYQRYYHARYLHRYGYYHRPHWHSYYRHHYRDQQGRIAYTAVTETTRTAVNVTASGGGGFKSCVIQHESGGSPTAVNSSSGAAGLFGFLPSTFHSIGFSGLPQNASVATQNAAFDKLFAQQGTAPWRGDGC